MTDNIDEQQSTSGKRKPDNDTVLSPKRLKREQSGSPSTPPRSIQFEISESSSSSGGSNSFSDGSSSSTVLSSPRRIPLHVEGITHLTCFLASERGKKHYQQDRTVAELDGSSVNPALNDTRYAFFAVYDGHGGEFSSEYLKKHLHLNIFGEIAKGCAILRDNPQVSPASSSAEKKSSKKNERSSRDDQKIYP